MSIPLKPIGREEIIKLEGALLVMVSYSEETLNAIKDPMKELHG
jgi:predicted transcriptional regulator